MADQRFRDLIAGVSGHAPVDEEQGERLPTHRVRAPGTEPGRPKRGQAGWKDPDVRRRGTEPPSGGIRGDRF